MCLWIIVSLQMPVQEVGDAAEADPQVGEPATEDAPMDQ